LRLDFECGDVFQLSSARWVYQGYRMESASYLKGLAVFCETPSATSLQVVSLGFASILRWSSSVVEFHSMMIMHSAGECLNDALLFGITFWNIFEYSVKGEIGL
jgi:hypothetical protein